MIIIIINIVKFIISVQLSQVNHHTFRELKDPQLDIHFCSLS